MIEHIFISKVRLKILKLYFLNLDTNLHIRGVSREIDEEINAVRRELRNLTEAKILSQKKNGNKIHYFVNLEGPLFYELLGLVHKEFGLGGTIIEKRTSIGDINFAILTSSYCIPKQNNDKDQEVDLMLIGEINLDNTSKIIKKIEKELDQEIRYTYMDNKEFELRKKKRDSFLTNIVNGHKIMLIGNEDELMI